ncbi:hypothetical protein [Sphingomonas jaspsi]|uniref:hypothetical protein n=1 Tax=Sphingomonas jaspsi TaxID=392409 RepID=UPI0004B23E22|nr:hypothetical protein [Sphingomonas jaspsi]
MNRRFDIPCRIAIEQSEEHFHAHVELDGDIPIYPGDRVRVHGDPVQVRFGESVIFDRMATVTRAGPLQRAWTKIAAYFDLGELYEVSFTSGRLK